MVSRLVDLLIFENKLIKYVLIKLNIYPILFDAKSIFS
jgi:hypothetical protein